MGLGRTPRKTSVISHVWIEKDGIFQKIFKHKQVCWPTMPEINDDVVSPTLPHVDHVVVIRCTKNIDLLGDVQEYSSTKISVHIHHT